MNGHCNVLNRKFPMTGYYMYNPLCIMYFNVLTGGNVTLNTRWYYILATASSLMCIFLQPPFLPLYLLLHIPPSIISTCELYFSLNLPLFSCHSYLTIILSRSPPHPNPPLSFYPLVGTLSHYIQ